MIAWRHVPYKPSACETNKLTRRRPHPTTLSLAGIHNAGKGVRDDDRAAAVVLLDELWSLFPTQMEARPDVRTAILAHLRKVFVLPASFLCPPLSSPCLA